MKKLVLLSVFILTFLCIKPDAAYAAEVENLVPTQQNLGITPYTSFVPTEKWVLYNNNYDWSAYINGYKLYSNYYFEVESPHRFRLFGTKRYEINTGYYVEIHNYTTGRVWRTYISKSQSGTPDFSYYDYNLAATSAGSQVLAGVNYYFAIDGSTTGCAASLDGGFHTY